MVTELCVALRYGVNGQTLIAQKGNMNIRDKLNKFLRRKQAVPPEVKPVEPWQPKSPITIEITDDPKERAHQGYATRKRFRIACHNQKGAFGNPKWSLKP